MAGITFQDLKTCHTWLLNEDPITDQIDLCVDDEGENFAYSYVDRLNRVIFQLFPFDHKKLDGWTKRQKIRRFSILFPFYNKKEESFFFRDFQKPIRVVKFDEEQPNVVLNIFDGAVMAMDKKAHACSFFFSPFPISDREVRILTFNDEGRIDPHSIVCESDLDPEKEISRWGKWAVTFVNTQDPEKDWAGHGGILVEGIDEYGDYFTKFAHIWESGSPYSIVINEWRPPKIFGWRPLGISKPMVGLIDGGRHESNEKTYLCDVFKVANLLKGVKEDQKLCEEYKQLWEDEDSGIEIDKEIKADVDRRRPWFNIWGRYSGLNKTTWVFGKYNTEEQAKNEIIAMYSEDPTFLSKLSIVKRKSKFVVIKKPDNCATWSMKMMAFYCHINTLKRMEADVIFSAPQMFIDRTRKPGFHVFGSLIKAIDPDLHCEVSAMAQPSETCPMDQ